MMLTFYEYVVSVIKNGLRKNVVMKGRETGLKFCCSVNASTMYIKDSVKGLFPGYDDVMTFT